MPPYTHVSCCHPPLLTRSQASHSTKQSRWHGHRVGAQDCHRLQAVPTTLSPQASLSGVRSQHLAPCAWPRSGSQPPPVKHASHAAFPAQPAAILTAVSLVPLQSVPGHENNKDSRLLWMGSSDCLISVGFSQVRSLPGRWH